MRHVAFACGALALAAALSCNLGPAAAQGSPQAREACTPDAMRLCSEFIPDVDKITACMNRRHRELSPQCVSAMHDMHGDHKTRVAGSGEEPHAHHGHRHYQGHSRHHHRVSGSH